MDRENIWDEPDFPHSIECPRCGIKYPPTMSKCQQCGLDLWEDGKRVYLNTPITRVVHKIVGVSREVMSATSASKAIVNELKNDVRESQISDSKEIISKLDDLGEKMESIEGSMKKGFDTVIDQTHQKSRSEKITWFILENSTSFIVTIILSYIIILLGLSFLL